MFNSTGLMLIIISAILGGIVQSNLKATFQKYSRKASSTNMTGEQVAQMIMDQNGVSDVRIELASGYLGDHFDPRNKVVRLSKENYYGNSIAAQAVAAHEVGHVLQYAENSSLLKIRTSIFPLAQFGSQMSGPFILIGFISSSMSLLWVGIICLAFGLLFQLATLPVEFDASKRAINQLQTLNINDGTTAEGSVKVLRAAAWTYVVGALVALLQIIRLVLIARNND